MSSPTGSYDDARIWEQVQSDTPTMLGFWNHNCAPCKVMAPVFDRLAKRFKHRIEFIAVNVYDRPDVAKRFGVASTPTFMITRRGKALRRFLGVIPEPVLGQYLEPYAPLPALPIAEPQRRGLLARVFRSGGRP